MVVEWVQRHADVRTVLQFKTDGGGDAAGGDDTAAAAAAAGVDGEEFEQAVVRDSCEMIDVHQWWGDWFALDVWAVGGEIDSRKTSTNPEQCAFSCSNGVLKCWVPIEMQREVFCRATLARVAELEQSGGVAAVEAAKAGDAEFAEAVVRQQILVGWLDALLAAAELMGWQVRAEKWQLSVQRDSSKVC
jgi:hypothetical protein